jgi:hypothetical protein
MNPEMQAMYNTCGGRESRSATAKMLMLESFPLLLISTSKIPFAFFYVLALAFVLNLKLPSWLHEEELNAFDSQYQIDKMQVQIQRC